MKRSIFDIKSSEWSFPSNFTHEAKYTREEIDNMLRRGEISDQQAQELLLENK